LSIIQQIFIIILCVIYTTNCKAQDKIEKSPKKAALYSTIIPGTGQVYTNKYWKIPIIYSGLIITGYYIKENNYSYQLYKNSYLNRLNGNNTNTFEQYSISDLKNLTDYYRRNREVSILLFSLIYVLNIIDASVNAHLFNYDVSENLSIHIQPKYITKENINLFTLSLNL
tara:strand:- start:7517 stop:8026 length:510 start_codon:yes stop_codon:yes gene_type:complete